MKRVGNRAVSAGAGVVRGKLQDGLGHLAGLSEQAHGRARNCCRLRMSSKSETKCSRNAAKVAPSEPAFAMCRPANADIFGESWLSCLSIFKTSPGAPCTSALMVEE